MVNTCKQKKLNRVVLNEEGNGRIYTRDELSV